MPTVAIIVINRSRPEITDKVVEQLRAMQHRSDVQTDLIVVECGSKKPDECSQYMTHWFRDPHYRGRYFGFTKGLSLVRQKREYDYYWFVVNDITFSSNQCCLTELIECMEAEPRMGLIGPGELKADDYRGAEPKPGRKWHKAATVHGLAHLIRGDVIHTIGYMNPKFHYSQGAGTEYSYKLYSNNWFMAYSDLVTVTHDQSGSTYGKVVPISRHEYHRRARKFASAYLAKHYGENWDQLFSSVLHDDIETNTFAWQKEVWNTRLDRNWRESYPWFWKMASRIKQLVGYSKAGE
jgi:hypothetical protein